ncbi:MAG: hypothetical protein M3485_00690 [Pseudomonadota bacterium]|nr:hypothetical protein [Pseudomonadota bacterium]
MSPPPEIRTSNWRAALSAALFAFALSRVLILLTAATSMAIAQQWSGRGGEANDIRLFTPQSVAALHGMVMEYDAGWYANVVTYGYEQRPFDTRSQANWAFFPLHPLTWRTLHATGMDLAWSGVLLANLFFLLALFQTHRWVQMLRDEATATRAVLCLALFPTAYFFSLPWSESLFLLLSASSLLAMEQRRWGQSTAFTALASATRPTGVFLAALMWWQTRDGRRVPQPRYWVLAALGCTGLFAFMALLWLKTGNPLAFSDIQAAWGRNVGSSRIEPLHNWLMDPLLIAVAWNTRWINNPALLLGLAGSVWLWRQKLRGLAFFSFICLLLPWSTGTLISMGRYVVSCVPLFLAFACWLERPRWWTVWLVVSVSLLVGMTASFTIGVSSAAT